MGFRDYPMPSSPASYISSAEVLSYIISYAERFQLNELIKFKHHVTRIRVIDTDKWEVCAFDCVQHIKITIKHSAYAMLSIFWIDIFVWFLFR